MMSEALVVSNANLFMVGLRKSPTTSSFEKQSQLQLPNPFVFKFHSTNLSRFITPTAAAAAATNRNSQAAGGGRSSGSSSRGYSSTDPARYKESYDKQRRNGIQDHYSRSTSSSSSSPSYSFSQKTDRQKTQEEAEDHQRHTFGKQMGLPDDESRDSRKTFRNSSGYGNSGGRYDDGNVQEGGNSSSYKKSSKGGGSGRYGGSLKANYDASYRGSSRSNSVNPDQRSSRSSRHRRRYPDKGLPKGMYEMVDNETGEKVFVWGTEDEELPVPTPADLKWEYTKTAISGDVSDESWYKAMEASMGGASGAFSVKGVRQGGLYREEEDDDEDSDYDTDEDNNLGPDEEPSDELQKESQQKSTRVSRSPKVRVFGRDFGARLSDVAKAVTHESKSQPSLPQGGNRGSSLESVTASTATTTTTTSEKKDVEIQSDQEATIPASRIGNSIPVGSHDSAAAILPAEEEVVDQPWPPVGPLTAGSYGQYSSLGKSFDLSHDGFEKASDTEDGEIVNPESGSWPPKGILSQGGRRGYRSAESSIVAGEENERWTAASLLDFDLGTNSDTQKVADDSSVMEKTTISTNEAMMSRSQSRRTPLDKISPLVAARTQTVVKVTTTTTQSHVSEQVGDDVWLGSVNPGIIEVTEGDETQRHRKMDRKDHQGPSKDREPSVATKSSFLDDLRIQTHRKLGSGPSPPPESLKTMNAKLVMRHEGSLETLNGTVDKSHPLLSKASGDDDDTATVVVKPRGMRDLNARSNFDPRLTDEYFGSKSFKDVGASEEVIKALRSLQVTRPSAIQAMAFKPVLEGQSCIIADQTGSGKTLAYVAPLVQSLRNEEANGAAKALSKKPRVLVLVPTSELAVQVLNVCRAVSKGGAPFRSIILTGGFKWKTQVESLVQGAEIVVATPGRFLQHLQSGTLQLNNLKCVVLDEVDILYDDEEFLEVLQTVEQAAAKHVQYVHVTATLPVDIHDSLLSRYPDSVPLMGPSLHRTAVGLQEILVDCSGAEGEEKTPEAAFVSKRTALLQLVDERPVSKTIVFCNKIETCRKVENALARHDRNETKLVVLPYHAALSQQARLESMQQFLESKPKKNMFLVCTDRASRGLDSFDVEHVVLFDFPRDPSEYVRRVGRTARGAGGTGKVFVFALGKQVAMARRIMARNEKGHPVHSVPGSQYET